ncbi:MAG TPA: putative leader peptide [Mycobacteriales bacterium]|nr:putative leader peptide [Mycobacteriales bacterium]
MYASALLVARLHVDLQRVTSAACRLVPATPGR